MSILNSKLTHNEILKRTGITCTKRKLSQARMGREPHRSDVKALLAGVDSKTLEEMEEENKIISLAATLIDMAEELVRIPIMVDDIVNQAYFTKYKAYIDLKVLYNRTGKQPRNHKELIRIHANVREKHKNIKNLLEVPKEVQSAIAV